MYVALEWDHKLAKPWLRWLVLECDHVAMKFGGPQAMPPRKDIAYFLDPELAERDAKLFAQLKNGELDISDLDLSKTASERHAAFVWDHNLFHPIVQWAVLAWDPVRSSAREDVAYFVNPSSAETDARAFRALRDQQLHTCSAVAR